MLLMGLLNQGVLPGREMVGNGGNGKSPPASGQSREGEEGMEKERNGTHKPNIIMNYVANWLKSWKS